MKEIIYTINREDIVPEAMIALYTEHRRNEKNNRSIEHLQSRKRKNLFFFKNKNLSIFYSRMFNHFNMFLRDIGFMCTSISRIE